MGLWEAPNGVKTSQIGLMSTSSLILIWVCTSQYHRSSAKSSPIDSSAGGSRFAVFGSPLLAHMIRDIAEELPHPTDKGRTLWDATNDDGKLFGLMGHANVSANEEVKPMELAKADNIGVYLLGSGSDFTVFLQRNGVGSMTNFDPIVEDNLVFVALDPLCRWCIWPLPS